MDITIYPRRLSGTVAAIPSKSQAHRLLICAAFADRPTSLICPDTNRDIQATAGCLAALGALIRRTDRGYDVTPVSTAPPQSSLDCGESGSTLRFLLPIVGALGTDATFHLAGRLPERPLSPLWELMEAMGCTLSRPSAHTVRCRGRLKSGVYPISGGVSSQFLSGLLFAAALLPEGGQVRPLGRVESRPYIDMTRRALAAFGVDTRELTVPPGSRLVSPGEMTVEGDWSNAAFFLAARAMGNPVTVTGLDPGSPQGDRAAADLLPRLEQFTTVSLRDIPDLAPILAVVAGRKAGARFTDAGRLRLKESDRVASTAAMLTALGAGVEAEKDAFTVHPGVYRGCTLDAMGDHRIAMAGAIAAASASGPVTILGAECVEKSYPDFWAVYRRIGGSYEQYLR